MNKILKHFAIFLLLPIAANANRLKEFITDEPGLIGTWSFNAAPAGKSVPYQMALWAPDKNTYSTSPTGVLTWYTCRTIIRIDKIPSAQLPDYNITKVLQILKNHEFYKIEDVGEFKIGYCSNRLGDQWPNYLLREISSGKYFIAGHLISQQRVQELLVSDAKSPYEAAVLESSRRQSGMAEFKIFSEVKRSKLDANTAPALKYAQERLRLREEIDNVLSILKDPSAIYDASHITDRKRLELQENLPHQPPNTAAQHANNKSASNATPIAETTVEHKTRITNPERYYLVGYRAIAEIRNVRYEKKEDKYVVDLYKVAGTEPLYNVGEQIARAAWYVSSQQFRVTNYAKVSDLQQCNFWTELYWTYTYEQETPNVWKEVNKYGAGRMPSNYCTDIRIDPDTCKWWCKRSPPPAEPGGYLVKDLAEAKSIYQKIVKPGRNRQDNNTTSPQNDPWKEYWDQKVKDSRQNVIEKW